MIYVSTIKRLAAWDLLTEKKVWEQTYDGECCDRMALSPDGRTMYVPSFEGMHWYVVDAKTGDLIKKLPVPASAGAHNTIWSLDGSRVFMAGLRGQNTAVVGPPTKKGVEKGGAVFSPLRAVLVEGGGTPIYSDVYELLGVQNCGGKTGK